MIRLEICANSLTSALTAEAGGAYRIELCDNLKEGGTTPSFAQIALARRYLNIKLYPIIRPRGGDFLYSDLEFEIMKTDIEQCRQLGCDGVVFGILTSDGLVDKERCRALKQAAGNMDITFHRAFDRCQDPFKALEDIVELGFGRILTSGLEATASAGAPLISSLIKQANNRIVVMPGAGIRPENFKKLIHLSGAKEYHATAKSTSDGHMVFKDVRTGSKKEEFENENTDLDIVKDLVKIAESMS
jgi:copper homeostasis protein